MRLSGQLKVAIEKLENHTNKSIESEQIYSEKTNIFNRMFKNK